MEGERTMEISDLKVGDVLEADMGYGPQRIRTTAVGEKCVLARRKFADGEEALENIWIPRQMKRVEDETLL